MLAFRYLLWRLAEAAGFLRDAIRRRFRPSRRFDVGALPAPPWAVRPDLPGDHIYWRMAGEQYFFAVRKAYAALTPAEQAAYDRAYPEPADWRGFLGRERKGVRLPRRTR